MRVPFGTLCLRPAPRRRAGNQGDARPISKGLSDYDSTWARDTLVLLARRHGLPSSSLPLVPLVGELVCLFDVLLLRGLVAAGEQEDQGVFVL